MLIMLINYSNNINVNQSKHVNHLNYQHHGHMAHHGQQPPQAITPFYSNMGPSTAQTYPSDDSTTDVNGPFGQNLGAQTVTTENDQDIYHDDETTTNNDLASSRNETNYSCTISVRRAIQHLVPNYC